ncbi:hypothetical protein D7Y27_07565 [Corallococcus sp. AB004]|nr:hypothetical protein D7Y27_07565 [Corallococcus sp. AB004]
MADKLPTHFVDLVSDAVLKSFWRKRSLQRFLRSSGIAERFFSAWSEDESKRDLLARLFPALEKNEKGPDVIRGMATALLEQKSFPDLEGWEDSDQKKKQATEAINSLREYVSRQKEEQENEKDRREKRQRAEARLKEKINQQSNLSSLSTRLTELSTRLGTQKAGYDFQDWFFDLLNHFEITCRRPYVVNGRQIDGSATVDGTTYLIELKFTSTQADAPDIDIFHKKVTDKADNTMGIMVSISGYSSIAIQGASGPRSPLLLLDHQHVFALLSGPHTFSDMIGRVRRHSSQTGEAYLSPGNF